MEYRVNRNVTEQPAPYSPWPRRCPKCRAGLHREVVILMSGSTFDRVIRNDARYANGLAGGWSCMCGFWEDAGKEVILTPELAQLARGVKREKQPEVYKTEAFGGRLSKAAQDAVKRYYADIERMLKKKTGWETIATLLRQITGAKFHHETLRRYYLLQQQERGA